ncbi:3-isopropylmalate dehydrogenase [Thermoleptolyngbya sp.]
MVGIREYRLVALPGEGVGPEVVEAALAVLTHLAALHQFSVQVEQGLIGEPAVQQFGAGFPEATARLCEGADSILFGAVSKAGLLELRKRFDLFANLRPVRPVKSLHHRSSIKPEKLDGVDILFVRELVSGIYFGPSGRVVDGPDPYGFHTMQYADAEIRRIARVALQQAQQRRKKLAIAHKENALPCIPWTQLVQEEAAAYPDVALMPILVDNLAMQLVMHPQQFDVILAGNLFGDILSDLGGAIAGSIGLLGSASLNADGFGMYEAIHGTAPDIAGKGIANPMGTLASVELMLQQWGEREAAAHLAIAQEQLLEAGYRTADLIALPEDRFVNTRAFTDKLIQQLTNTQAYERT